MKIGVFSQLVASLALTARGGGSDDAPVSDNPFDAVDSVARAALEAEGIPGMGLAIYNRNGVKVFEHMYGDFSPDLRVPIASASKLVAGVTLFRLMDAGYLTPDSTTGQVLGWTGDEGAIRLRTIEPHPDVVIGKSPAPGLRYGLTAWLECSTPQTGCHQISSPGAFGFTPWIDRDAGYYAILGMQDMTNFRTHFGGQLERQLQPLIARALRETRN